MQLPGSKSCSQPTAPLQRQRYCGTSWEPASHLEKGSWEKGETDTSLLLSGGQMLRLEGFRPLPLLSALYRPLIWKGTDAHASLAGWSAAAQVREQGTKRLRIVTGIFRELAVQSRSSLNSFAPIAMAVFSNSVEQPLWCSSLQFPVQQPSHTFTSLPQRESQYRKQQGPQGLFSVWYPTQVS